MEKKKCVNCGAEFETEKDICPSCGLTGDERIKFVNKSEEVVEPVNTNGTIDNINKVVEKNSKFFPIVGMFSGLLSIFLGFIALDKNTGYYEAALKYGGDAYTGMQNASAQAANNAMYAAEILSFGFGSLLIVLGIVIVCYFGMRISSDEK